MEKYNTDLIILLILAVIILAFVNGCKSVNFYYDRDPNDYNAASTGESLLSNNPQYWSPKLDGKVYTYRNY